MTVRLNRAVLLAVLVGLAQVRVQRVCVGSVPMCPHCPTHGASTLTTHRRDGSLPRVTPTAPHPRSCGRGEVLP